LTIGDVDGGNSVTIYSSGQNIDGGGA
jgi:hypothetical protein